jgi:hypothetical protein
VKFLVDVYDETGENGGDRDDLDDGEEVGSELGEDEGVPRLTPNVTPEAVGRTPDLSGSAFTALRGLLAVRGCAVLPAPGCRCAPHAKVYMKLRVVGHELWEICLSGRVRPCACPVAGHPVDEDQRCRQPSVLDPFRVQLLWHESCRRASTQDYEGERDDRNQL